MILIDESLRKEGLYQQLSHYFQNNPLHHLLGYYFNLGVVFLLGRSFFNLVDFSEDVLGLHEDVLVLFLLELLLPKELLADHYIPPHVCDFFSKLDVIGLCSSEPFEFFLSEL